MSWKSANNIRIGRIEKVILGQKFGKLTPIRFFGIDKRRGERLWECRCDCGNIKLVRTVSLTHGIKSCGCLNYPKRSGKERLLRRIPKKIYKVLKGGISYSLFGLVGYSKEELHIHIELQFTPKMSWNNYGIYWVIDHVIPRRLFNEKNKIERLMCWSLPNLQPLAYKENEKDKRGRIDYYSEEFYNNKLEEIRQFVKKHF